MLFAFGPTPTARGASVVFSFEERELTQAAQDLDRASDGSLKKALEVSKFKGKKAEILHLIAPRGTEASRVLLVGLGSREKLNRETLEHVGGALMAFMRDLPDGAMTLRINGLTSTKLSEAEIAAYISSGVQLRSWRFSKYHTKDKDERQQKLQDVHVITTAAHQAETLFRDMAAVAEGAHFTRELVTEPGNVIYPETLAQRIESLKDLGVTVEVLALKELQKLGMGALLGVAQGSINEPRVAIMRWNGGKADDKPVAFVGKGVTFDTGGICLKPSGSMWEMKYDMAGAGAVIGTLKALAGRKAKVNAVGVVGLVENMPSGSAQRPGDVVTSMSGQTIEVIDTDAEGRLVLADVLWYTQDRFKPQVMVDLATLTGAISIALGDQFAGLFSNNDDLSSQLIAAGDEVGERLWRMPLTEKFDRDIDSDIADMKNLGPAPKAGSTTAAQFLQRFVNGIPWAHLDIAGMAWAEKGLPIAEKGATAYGVRLLDQLVRQFYEK
ncbi:MAG: leucyl aminopeptidase [Holosporales bacterium]